VGDSLLLLTPLKQPYSQVPYEYTLVVSIVSIVCLLCEYIGTSDSMSGVCWTSVSLPQLVVEWMMIAICPGHQFVQRSKCNNMQTQWLQGKEAKMFQSSRDKSTEQ